METTYSPMAETVGYVFASFIFTVPLSLFGVFWNAWIPNKKFNPWTLALGAGFLLAWVIVSRKSPEEGLIVALSFVPGFVFCLTRWFRWRKAETEES